VEEDSHAELLAQGHLLLAERPRFRDGEVAEGETEDMTLPV
jgi:hypothetical protein